jgi:hypothetical protein
MNFGAAFFIQQRWICFSDQFILHHAESLKILSSPTFKVHASHNIKSVASTRLPYKMPLKKMKPNLEGLGDFSLRGRNRHPNLS